MRKLVLAAAAAVALASPASAQLYPNPFNDALQAYQVDQSLNALAAQTRQNYQNSVNRGLGMINPPMPAVACTPWNRSQGWC